MIFEQVEHAGRATTVMMCGLPASGKTTTAMRLHAQLGGVLIRSCDIYQELGIVLSEWVRRTQGFTVNVAEYDRRRDEAYVEMARRLEASLVAGSRLVIVDAVHGERGKRRRLYEICHVRGAVPILLLCLCGDSEEVYRRFRARQGRESEPEHEASDLAVFRDIRHRWQAPLTDELPDGSRPTLLTYDTIRGRAGAITVAVPTAANWIGTALVTPCSERHAPCRCADTVVMWSGRGRTL